ncbi:DUF6463 family protein [Agromyces endophyticus]|uniref:DUF6463 family protein n=1 Tax=Agromyces sp. H17E-10 TaxID=2932244 RepID=UPI001FD04411|nr:DUF6463 family protein [Agromyces sp. H17E-10]UOQ88305.1 DUF6463 family protein [Agromyces sp. H17E-10]
MTRRRNDQRTAIAGPALIIVCALHSVVGGLAASPVVGQALADGWYGAMTSGLEVALWFLMTGFFGLALGVAMTSLERAGRMPWPVSIALLAIALIGVAAAPVSGFLLVLVAGVIAVVQSARLQRRRASDAPGAGESAVGTPDPRVIAGGDR